MHYATQAHGSAVQLANLPNLQPVQERPFIIDVCCSDEESLGVRVQPAADVEAILVKHDAVKQAVAIGVADNRLVEVVAVSIEFKTGKSVTEEEIMHYCRQHLARFKVPRRVQFIEHWPMTGAGKNSSYVLKESLAQGVMPG